MEPGPSRAVPAPIHPRGVAGANRLSREERLAAGAVGVGLVALLGIARWLEPDPSGVGTHTQLGLPPTFVMERFGTPCPFCGMTTAFAHTMEADLAAAVLTQPAGTLLALLSILAVPLCFALAAGGWRPAWLFAAPVWLWGARGLVTILAAGWVYKLWAVWTGFPG